MFRIFVGCRNGNFALMVAILMPILIGAAGFAVDISTLSNARIQLQNATDAAVLAASRLSDRTLTREEVFDNYLEANLTGARELANVRGELTVDEGLNVISTSAVVKADVRLHFGFLFGGNRRIAVEAGATESSMDLEIAMVLDNTGSMGASRMQSLRDAATAMANILESAKGMNRSVKAALVPFVTAVNVKGTGYKESWIDVDGMASYHGVNFDRVPTGAGSAKVNHFDLFKSLGQTWKGCVEARAAPYNLTDDAPNPKIPDTMFVPYFAPDEPGDAKKSGDSSSKFNNSYLDDIVSGTERQRQASLAKYVPGTRNVINEKGPLTNGPNYACPTPIMPLTENFDTLRAEISRMIYWNGSGTNVSEGLAWGLRVLSPAEPFAQGAPFNSDRVSKSVVVFTDGENNVFGASGEPINKSDYGSYGFVDEGRIDSDRGKALRKVNEWTQTVCTTLKDKGVTVFTVLLGADTAANRELYSKCASKPGYYFPTKDVSELTDIFQKIGAAVTQLYVTN